eukprot:TRINITY_DN8302_c0_g1_i3.p2 TRINITY_DN8302_c0_g1~~TRINITY_DN8302_c0_g1_i3.p2  ORF type:complete len:165 (-),score=2.46 TRINITY_DN8302_c0_g1_i3:666-1160(-)
MHRLLRDNRRTQYLIIFQSNFYQKQLFQQGRVYLNRVLGDSGEFRGTVNPLKIKLQGASALKDFLWVKDVFFFYLNIFSILQDFQAFLFEGFLGKRYFILIKNKILRNSTASRSLSRNFFQKSRKIPFQSCPKIIKILNFEIVLVNSCNFLKIGSYFEQFTLNS